MENPEGIIQVDSWHPWNLVRERNSMQLRSVHFFELDIIIIFFFKFSWKEKKGRWEWIWLLPLVRLIRVVVVVLERLHTFHSYILLAKTENIPSTISNRMMIFLPESDLYKMSSPIS